MGLYPTWPAPCLTLQEVRSHASWHVAMATPQDQDVAPTALCSYLLVQEPQLLGPLHLGGAGSALVWSHIARPYSVSDGKALVRSGGKAHSMDIRGHQPGAASLVAVCVPGLGLVFNPSAKQQVPHAEQSQGVGGVFAEKSHRRKPFLIQVPFHWPLQ